MKLSFFVLVLLLIFVTVYVGCEGKTTKKPKPTKKTTTTTKRPRVKTTEEKGKILYTVSSRYMRYLDAFRYCASMNMTLLQMKPNMTMPKLYERTWVEARQVWADDKSFYDMKRNNVTQNMEGHWAAGEPNNFRNSEECAVLWTSKKLIDTSCCKGFKAVCFPIE